ncbi:MAG: hypothetical protein M5U34_02995 [Chloroflexi bacterium]|nr:hypothetical protein [Chloroflexota bacterium]
MDYYNYLENSGSILVETDSPLVAYMQQTPEVLDLAVQRAWPSALRQFPEDYFSPKTPPPSPP